MDELIAKIVLALKTRSTLPQFPNSLTVTDAYEVQHQVVARLGSNSIVGIKAGLTSEGSQESFGISHPIVGRLFESGRLFSGAVVKAVSGVCFECEIGLCVDVSGRPTSVCPVIELPRLAFTIPTDASGANLIACNVGAERFIIGECLEIPASFADRSVELKRDGNLLYQASLTEPLGGPLDSLSWMMAEAQTREISIPDQALMLTGACGGIHPALPGQYVADYGSLGTVDFEVLVE